MEDYGREVELARSTKWGRRDYATLPQDRRNYQTEAFLPKKNLFADEPRFRLGWLVLIPNFYSIPTSKVCWSSLRLYVVASEVWHLAFFDLCKPEKAWKSLKAISKKSSVSTLKKLVVMGPEKARKAIKKKLKKAKKAEHILNN